MGALYYGRVCVLSATLLAVVTACVKVGVSDKVPPYGVHYYEAHRKNRASNDPMYGAIIHILGTPWQIGSTSASYVVGYVGSGDLLVESMRDS